MKSYTNVEKLSFICQNLRSGLSKSAFCRDQEFSTMSLIKWQRKFGITELQDVSPAMKKANVPDETERLQSELISLRKQLKQMEKLLKEEKLKNMANELIIDLAESTFHIPIRKKSDAK